MRILGIDHGTVRVGLALSDELGMLAHPLETVAEAQALVRIPEVVRARGVTAVVLGWPLRMDGSEGTAAERVRGFLNKLRPLISAMYFNPAQPINSPVSFSTTAILPIPFLRYWSLIKSI
jgi:RNase H-fold protein (predicted Holliday junction resolvase)